MIARILPGRRYLVHSATGHIRLLSIAPNARRAIEVRPALAAEQGLVARDIEVRLTAPRKGPDCA